MAKSIRVRRREFAGACIAVLGVLTGTAHGQSLTSVALMPADSTIPVGRNQAFTAIGTFSDGSVRPLSTQVLAGGDHHSCAILSDGSARCWGWNGHGQLGNGDTNGTPSCAGIGGDPCIPVPTPVINVGNAAAIGAGLAHTCAIAEGNVLCWGADDSGQIGDPSLVDSGTPRLVPTAARAVAVTGGAAHTCALLSNGTVQCWGSNLFGDLGNDNPGVDSAVPVTVFGITTAVAIASGAFGDHTCALLADGTVRCWGANDSGQLGNGRTFDRSEPVPVVGVANVVAIAAGASATCALRADKTVWCWGANDVGQLGTGSTSAYSSTPVPVLNVTKATAVTMGFNHACALLEDHSVPLQPTRKVHCWGANDLGQLGDGSLNNSPSPVLVSGITDALAIQAGDDHTCAALETGAVECWGSNDLAQLGDGTYGGHSEVPVVAIGAKGAISAGGNPGGGHACLVLDDGRARCWGGNLNGQLGNGTASDSALPVEVQDLSDAIRIATGSAHTCALRLDGTVQCWGDGGFGQLGNGSRNGSRTPVPVTGITTARAVATGPGADFTCALLRDGTVSCWGRADQGQLGTGPTTATSYEVPQAPVIGITSATAIAVGGRAFGHACALLADGTVQCWGSHVFAPINGTPAYAPVSISGLSNVSSIAVGDDFTCALLADGTVWCWGANGTGQLGIGNAAQDVSLPTQVTGLTNAVAISAGADHACALQVDGTVACWGGNDAGQLGIGDSRGPFRCVRSSGFAFGAGFCSPEPIAVGVLRNGVALTRAVAIAAGDHFTCALVPDGTASCWGDNNHGQLGNGTFTGPSTCTVQLTFPCGPLPESVSGLRPFAPVTALHWASTDTAVAAIAQDGVAAGRSDGIVGISASAGPVIGSTTLTVGTPSRTLSLTLAGSGLGSVSGGGTYGVGQTAFVSTTASTGSTFSGWGGPNGAECATGSVLMDADKSCTATFALTTRSLTLSTAGNGSGSVSGSGVYSFGTTVPVSAVASLGSVFGGWSGPNGAECATASVLMDADKSCTATFTLTTRSLTLSTGGSGSGSVSGGGVYSFGTTVPVSALASPGSVFGGWSGPNGAECATASVLMDADKACTATFALVPASNTPAGNNVAVSPAAGISLIFATVTTAGQTSASTSSTGPALPSGFQLGSPPVYYDITTTAVYLGPVQACLTYGSGQTNPSTLRLLHYESSAWVDTTTSNDTTNFVICGQVTGLSPFVVAQPPLPVVPLLDDFNRLDGGLGGNWSGSCGPICYRVAGQRLDAQAGGPAYWSPGTFGRSQAAFVTLSAVDPRSPSQGLLLKVQTGRVPDAGAIAVVYDAVARQVRVSTLRPGLAWTPYRGIPVALGKGDKLTAWAREDGVVRIYRNDAPVGRVTLTATDQAFFDAKGGKIGLWSLGAANAFFDDFGGGTVAP